VEISYEIVSSVEDEAIMVVKLGDESVEAKVKVLVIEAMSSDGSMCHTFRLRGAKAEDFPVGGAMSAKLAVAK
jgi:hypothetical protein